MDNGQLLCNILPAEQALPTHAAVSSQPQQSQLRCCCGGGYRLGSYLERRPLHEHLLGEPPGFLDAGLDLRRDAVHLIVDVLRTRRPVTVGRGAVAVHAAAAAAAAAVVVVDRSVA